MAILNQDINFVSELDLGEDIITCEESITLDVGGGYESYSWSTLENTQTIQVNQSGNYIVNVIFPDNLYNWFFFPNI